MTMNEALKKERITLLTQRIKAYEEMIAILKEVANHIPEKNGKVINKNIENWLHKIGIENVKINSGKDNAGRVPYLEVWGGDRFKRLNQLMSLHKITKEEITHPQSKYCLDADWVVDQIWDLVKCMKRTIAKYQDCIDNFDEYITYGKHLMTDLKHYQEVVPYEVRFVFPLFSEQLYPL